MTAALVTVEHAPPATKAAPIAIAQTRVYAPDRLTLDEIFRIAEGVSRANLSTSNPQTILAKILFGQEVGIGPMQALKDVHIIEGTPTLDASLVAAKIKGSGKYDYQILELNDDKCSIKFEQGDKLLGISTFTIEDAKRAKLLGKKTQTWEKYPRNMTFSRAMTNGASWFCGDVMGGRVYTPEELNAVVTVDDNGVQHIVESADGSPLMESDAGPVDIQTGEVIPPAANATHPPELLELRRECKERAIAPELVLKVLGGFGVERMSALPPNRIEAFRRALFGAAARNVTPAATPKPVDTAPAPAAAQTPTPAAAATQQQPRTDAPADLSRLRASVATRIAELRLPPEIVTKMVVECAEGKSRSIDDPNLKADALFRLEGRLKALQVAPSAAETAQPVDRVATLRQFALDNNLRDRAQAMLADIGVKTLADIPPNQLEAFEAKLRSSVTATPPAGAPASQKIGEPAHLR